MKTLFRSILAIAFVAALAIPARAQFGAGAAGVRPAIVGTPTTVFIVPGETTTNLPASLAASVPVGELGFGVSINHSGTNTSTTTNTTFTFEFSGDAVNFATNNRLSILSIPLGTAYAPHFTNIANTVPNVGNAVYVRLKSIQNTNIASIFITNLNISTR